MNRFLLLICVFSFLQLSAQQNIKTYNEPESSGYKIFFDNDEYAPVSAVIEYKLKNMQSRLKSNTVVIPARSKKYLVDNLSIVDKHKSSSYKMDMILHYGNGENTVHNDEFQYHLPFLKDNKFRIDQAYNGRFSHTGLAAIDFVMPTGTTVTAARGGTVIVAISNFNYGCPEERCKDSANRIMIMHDDGTFADYAHLKKDGNLVKVGDVVAQDQPIAYSGNTGWSSAPHLHFSVCKYTNQGQETIETVFLTAHEVVTKLEEGKSYRKDY